MFLLVYFGSSPKLVHNCITAQVPYFSKYFPGIFRVDLYILAFYDAVPATMSSVTLSQHLPCSTFYSLEVF